MAKLIIKFKGKVINEFALAATVITIGRSADNDIVIDHPAISGKHAQIEFKAGRYTLVDLNSTNGVIFNRTRVTSLPLSHATGATIGLHNLYFHDPLHSFSETTQTGIASADLEKTLHVSDPVSTADFENVATTLTRQTGPESFEDATLIRKAESEPAADATLLRKTGPESSANATLVRKVGSNPAEDATLLRKTGPESSADATLVRKVGSNPAADETLLRKTGPESSADATLVRKVGSEPAADETLLRKTGPESSADVTLVRNVVPATTDATQMRKPSHPSQGGMVGYLQVVSGVANKQLCELNNRVTTIGTAEGSEIRLLSPSAPNIAALISRSPSGYVLNPVNESAPPSINGHVAYKAALLRTGDIISFGELKMLFTLKGC